MFSNIDVLLVVVSSMHSKMFLVSILVQYSYPHITHPTLIRAADLVLGECGMLVCHTGRAETMRNLPVSLWNTIGTEYDSNNNRWVAFIDSLHHSSSSGFQNVVDYNENNEKIVIGMKCQQCRANWIWNPAVLQIQIKQRMKPNVDWFWDGPTMVHYQFPSRIVEEVWCRHRQYTTNMEYTDNVDSCTGHGFDPEQINIPVSSLRVDTSLVADHGGRGVFTTQAIGKGSMILLDDCVEGMILPISTLKLFETATQKMTNGSNVWHVVVDGFAHGYGWSESFLVRFRDFSFDMVLLCCLVFSWILTFVCVFLIIREDRINWVELIPVFQHLSIMVVVERIMLVSSMTITK